MMVVADAAAVGVPFCDEAAAATVASLLEGRLQMRRWPACVESPPAVGWAHARAHDTCGVTFLADLQEIEMRMDKTVTGWIAGMSEGGGIWRGNGHCQTGKHLSLSAPLSVQSVLPSC